MIKLTATHLNAFRVKLQEVEASEIVAEKSHNIALGKEYQAGIDHGMNNDHAYDAAIATLGDVIKFDLAEFRVSKEALRIGIAEAEHQIAISLALSLIED